MIPEFSIPLILAFSFKSRNTIMTVAVLLHSQSSFPNHLLLAIRLMKPTLPIDKARRLTKAIIRNECYQLQCMLFDFPMLEPVIPEHLMARMLIACEPEQITDKLAAFIAGAKDKWDHDMENPYPSFVAELSNHGHSRVLALLQKCNGYLYYDQGAIYSEKSKECVRQYLKPTYEYIIGMENGPEEYKKLAERTSKHSSNLTANLIRTGKDDEYRRIIASRTPIPKEIYHMIVCGRNQLLPIRGWRGENRDELDGYLNLAISVHNREAFTLLFAGRSPEPAMLRAAVESNNLEAAHHILMAIRREHKSTKPPWGGELKTPTHWPCPGKDCLLCSSRSSNDPYIIPESQNDMRDIGVVLPIEDLLGKHAYHPDKRHRHSVHCFYYVRERLFIKDAHCGFMSAYDQGFSEMVRLLTDNHVVPYDDAVLWRAMTDPKLLRVLLQRDCICYISQNMISAAMKHVEVLEVLLLRRAASALTNLQFVQHSILARIYMSEDVEMARKLSGHGLDLAHVVRHGGKITPIRSQIVQLLIYKRQWIDNNVETTDQIPQASIDDHESDKMTINVPIPEVTFS